MHFTGTLDVVYSLAWLLLW